MQPIQPYHLLNLVVGTQRLVAVLEPADVDESIELERELHALREALDRVLDPLEGDHHPNHLQLVSHVEPPERP